MVWPDVHLQLAAFVVPQCACASKERCLGLPGIVASTSPYEEMSMTMISHMTCDYNLVYVMQES